MLAATVRLHLFGTIGKVLTDIFKDLTSLRYLQFRINNYRGFVHANGIEWMQYLNFYREPFEPELALVNESLSNETQYRLNAHSVFIVFFDENNIAEFPPRYFPLLFYEFPDEDFCLFADYPHKKLIFTSISSSSYSCTLLWIYKYAAFYAQHGFNSSDFLHTFPKYIFHIYDRSEFESAYNACHIPQRIAKCQLQSIHTAESMASYEDSYFNLYDIANGIQLARVYLIGYAGPGVCFVAFVTNILVIVTILNARRKRRHIDETCKKLLTNLNEAFFTYMLINSILNSIYCAIYFFDYSIGCKPILVDSDSTKDNCLQKDIWIGTFGNILKLMGNFTSIQMSLNRYLLVGKDHQKWIVKVAKAKIGSMIGFFLILSTVLSLVVIFQDYFFSNPVVDKQGMLHNENYFYHHYLWATVISSDSTYTYQEIDSLDDKLTKQLPFIFAFTFIHDLFSYFLFCIFITVIDIMTVLKLKQSLAEKSHFTSANSAVKNEEQAKAEIRSIIMIVLNSLSNFLFRSPELVSTVFFYAISFGGDPHAFKLLCHGYNVCLSIVEIANPAYILSLSFNFFFYYFFNKAFKFSFKFTFAFLCKKHK
jgi:hypothetical protein